MFLFLHASFVLLLLLLSSSVTPSTAQNFVCSIKGFGDEDRCLDTTSADDQHCVWCQFGGDNGDKLLSKRVSTGLGLCVTEAQAEAMEDKFANAIICDRYSNTTDDDAITPTDDTIPDDFWTCLQEKTSKACLKANCTWCDTKAGFGVCMTGPAADSANNSDWYTTCTKSNKTNSFENDFVTIFFQHLIDSAKSFHSLRASSNTIEVNRNDLFDLTCARGFFQGKDCQAIKDDDGEPCKICHTPDDLAKLCLTSAQGDLATQVGVWCDDVVVATD